MAKFNIERYYSVVGVLERMDQTLAVLENYVPKFFSGVTQIYNQLGMLCYTKYTPTPSSTRVSNKSM